MVDCGDGSWGREREAWEVGEQKWFEGREFYGWCGAVGVARTKTVGFVVSRPNLDGQCIAQCVAESGHPDTGHFTAYLVDTKFMHYTVSSSNPFEQTVN